MMYLKVNGTIYEGFISAAVKRSLNSLCGEFSFKATTEESSNFPIQRLSEVEIYIDDTLILTGYVDQIKISYSNNSHTIDINGRDKSLVLVDSSVVNRTFNAPTNLEKIAQKIIDDLSADIGIVNNVSDLKKIKKEDLTNIISEHDESAFSFLDRIAKISNVLITTGSDGDINIIRNEQDNDVDTILVNNRNENKNDILSATVTYSDMERFRYYTCYAQKDDLPEISNAVQSVQKGEIAEDDEALESKQKVIILENAGNIDDCTAMAKWESNIRRAKSIVASYLIGGHYYDESNNNIWEAGLLVRVADALSNLYSEMLINSVEYKFNLQDGSTTQLELIPADAYTVNPSFSLGNNLSNEYFGIES